MLPECKIIFCKFRPLIEGKFAKICHVQNHAHYQTNPAKNYQRLVTFLPQWRISPSLVSLTRRYSFSLSLSLPMRRTQSQTFSHILFESPIHTSPTLTLSLPLSHSLTQAHCWETDLKFIEGETEVDVWVGRWGEENCEHGNRRWDKS